MSVEDAFAYMADLMNFLEWEPGVEAIEQVKGSGPEVGAVYDVTIPGFTGPTTLPYTITELEQPTRVVAHAENTLFTAHDVMSVTADGEGAIITFDGTFLLNGMFGWFNPTMEPIFRKVADRAAKGLAEALDGERFGIS
jgi:hypothetical protein